LKFSISPLLLWGTNTWNFKSQLVPGQLTVLSIAGDTAFRLDFYDISYVVQERFREMWQQILFLSLVTHQCYLIYGSSSYQTQTTARCLLL